jgi:hypothetical protein
LTTGMKDKKRVRVRWRMGAQSKRQAEDGQLLRLS